MKKIFSLLAIAAVVLVACKTKKPTAETVSAEAAKAANALVEAIASGDEAAIKEAYAAKQAVLKTLKIEDDEEMDAIFADAFDVALEEVGVDEEDIDALLKLRGIELPVMEKAEIDEAAAETADNAEEIMDAAAEEIEVPFALVQQKPGFGGAGAEEFNKWVHSNIVYPEAAQAAGTEGRVVLKFKVDKDGTIKNVKVVKSVDPELDAEAVRVVSEAPAWTPGMQNGEPVAVSYVFPVVYKLQQ